MQFTNILALSAIAFTSIASAAPTVLNGRAGVEVDTDGNTATITPVLSPDEILAGLTADKRQALEARAGVTVNTDGNTTTITPVLSSDEILAGLTATKTKRQVTFAVDQVVLAIIDKVQALVQNLIDGDTNRRIFYTQQIVGSAAIQFPDKNIIISKVGYDFTDTPTTVQRAVYNAKVGADVDFDVLVFESGTFTLKSGGGFQNWAYSIADTCTVSGGVAILQC